MTRYMVLLVVAAGMLTGCGGASRMPVGVSAPVVRSQAILDPGYNPAPNYPHNPSPSYPGYNPSPSYPGYNPTPNYPHNPSPSYPGCGQAPKANPRLGTRAILPPYVNPGCR